MMRRWLMMLGAVAFLLGGCGPEDPQAGEVRAEFVKRYPTYTVKSVKVAAAEGNAVKASIEFEAPKETVREQTTGEGVHVQKIIPLTEGKAELVLEKKADGTFVLVSESVTRKRKEPWWERLKRHWGL